MRKKKRRRRTTTTTRRIRRRGMGGIGGGGRKGKRLTRLLLTKPEAVRWRTLLYPKGHFNYSW